MARQTQGKTSSLIWIAAAQITSSEKIEVLLNSRYCEADCWLRKVSVACWYLSETRRLGPKAFLSQKAAWINLQGSQHLSGLSTFGQLLQSLLLEALQWRRLLRRPPMIAILHQRSKKRRRSIRDTLFRRVEPGEIKGTEDIRLSDSEKFTISAWRSRDYSLCFQIWWQSKRPQRQGLGLGLFLSHWLPTTQYLEADNNKAHTP